LLLLLLLLLRVVGCFLGCGWQWMDGDFLLYRGWFNGDWFWMYIHIHITNTYCSHRFS
jgi:hypothetical protein